MNQQTVELMCLLQQGTSDPESWAQIEALLPDQRRQLAEAGRPAELADLCDLLEAWGRRAPAPFDVAALLQAGSLAEVELQQEERAIALFQECLERDRTEFEPWHRLEGLLQRRGEHARMESILAAQAEAMLARADIDRTLTANAYQRLGQLRLEHGNADRAIDAYEQAIDLAPDNETLAELARAYCERGSDSDQRQAADLYCALGDVLPGADGVAMLERALDLAPDHDEALELLERAIPEDEHATRLSARWEAYLEHSTNEQGLDARRLKLQRTIPSTPAPTLSNGPGVSASAPVAQGRERKEEDRSWDPKTLMGIGLPAALQVAAHPAPDETDPVRVPPLFSGRAPARDEQAPVELEGEGEWPEQLALVQDAEQSMPSGRAPMLSSSPFTSDHDSEDLSFGGYGEASGAPRSNAPSYAFAELPGAPGAIAAAQSQGGLGKWAVLLGGAAVLGISAGVAIAYGLRSSAASPLAESATATSASAVGAGSTPPAETAEAEPQAAVANAAGNNAAANNIGALDPAAAGSATTNSGAPAEPAIAAATPPPSTTQAPAAVPAAGDPGEVKVAAKQVKARGGLTSKEVATALEAGLEEIESCYDSALARKATLRGTLKFSWAIDRAGKASRLKKLGGSLKDATVERCSLDTIRGLQFPASSKKRPTHVIAPLSFETRTNS